MKKNLKDLLDEYEVEIPALQRNYVHGASTPRAKEIREHFLDEFVKLLQGDKKTFDLNFIYGENRDGKIVPVDGQQRLTTLWLLAAYIVNHYCEDEENKNEWRRRLEKFSYARRPLAAFASRCIANGDSVEELNRLGLCREIATETMVRTHVLRSGTTIARHDITTDAIAQTLATIAKYDHDLEWRGKYKGHFGILEHALNRVTFEFEDIRQSADETYIKMNARGKTLTQWENFKGKFAELLPDDDKKNGLRARWSRAVEVATDKYIACHTDDKPLQEMLPDNSFFALVARILLYESSRGKTKEQIKEATKEFTNLVELTQYGFTGVVPFVPFDEFKGVMDALGGDRFSVVEKCIWFIGRVTGDDGCFFSEHYFPYWEPQKTLWQVVFKPNNDAERDFGLILYEYVNEFDKPESLGIRLIANIIENSNSENRVRDCLKFFTNGPKLYGKQHIDSEIEQVEEEIKKADIYEGGDHNLVTSMQRFEVFMHGRIRIALLPYRNGDTETIARHIEALNCFANKWNEAIKKSDETSLRFMLAMVVMSMPYWPKEDKFPFEKKDGALRILLQKNEVNLAYFLPEFLHMNPDAKPEEFLAGNPLGFNSSEQQAWRRDWQNNLLWIIESNFEEILGKKVEYHYSDCFYFYKGGNIKWAIPLNDYRFDFICNDKLKIALRDFYRTVGVNDNEISMTMNDSSTRSTEVYSRDKKKRHLYFYKDHVAISYCTKIDDKEEWSPQLDVVFSGRDKSIFAPDELTARVNEFFDTIREAINSEFFDPA